MSKRKTKVVAAAIWRAARLRLFLFRPRWHGNGHVQYAQHRGLTAVVIQTTDNRYAWLIADNIHTIAECQYTYADPRHAKYIARAGLLAGAS